MDIEDLNVLPSAIRNKIIAIHFKAIHQDKFGYSLKIIKDRNKPKIDVFAYTYNMLRLSAGMCSLSYSS